MEIHVTSRSKGVMTVQSLILMAAALSGLLAVIAGAIGAHGAIAESDAAGRWQIANQFQFYHCLMLLFVGLLLNHAQHAWVCRFLAISGVANIAGVILFCGVIYGRVWSDIYGALTLFGAEIRLESKLTPLGGALLMLSWFCLFMSIVINWLLNKLADHQE